MEVKTIKNHRGLDNSRQNPTQLKLLVNIYKWTNPTLEKFYKMQHLSNVTMHGSRMFP